MEGIIKLSDETNLFYDSVKRQYRYRMHCPECGVVSGCRCFDELEELESVVGEGMLDLCCSNKCALVYNVTENGDYEFIQVLIEKGYISWWNRLKNHIIRESEDYNDSTAKLYGFFISFFKIKLSYSELACELTEEQSKEISDELYSDWDFPEGESCDN